MQLVESGDVALGIDVNRYLERARVPDTYPGPITVADLLRHTSGLDELPGRRFEQPGNVPPFHAFMATHLVRYRPAGELTSYSSYGIALAGLLIEEVTGASYGDHLDTSLFRPLGMTSTRIMDEPGEDSGLAAGYEIEDGKAQRIGYEWYATPPVASAVTSGHDIGRLLLALTSAEPAILSAKSLQQMMSTQATLHPAVPGWGYGFQLDEVNGHRLAEHGGDIGGFASLLAIVPAKRFGFFVVHHGEGSSLRYQVRDALLDRFFPVASASQPSMARVDPTPYAGTYRASWFCHTCDDPPPVPEFEVSVNDDGTLSLWGNRWVPIDRDLFRREDGRGKLAFRRDESGRIVALSGGSWRVGERVR
jgi:CubicO group peptidase (beta-lactamase class C family)